MRRRWLHATLALALVPATAIAAPRDDEAMTGATTRVRARTWPRGLESDLPPGSIYFQALDAARAERWRAAERLFAAAITELRRAVLDGDLDHARGRALMYKARLAERSADGAARADKELEDRASLQVLAIYAGAVHDLYLASSAALGRSDERLFAIVDRAYARYLLYDPRGATSDPVRVAHAALLAADGHRDAAAEEYARVAPSTPDPVPDPLRAHYFAVLGDTERALHWLRLARERDPGWSSRRIQLRVANDLDALRDDPRFVELLGPDE